MDVLHIGNLQRVVLLLLSWAIWLESLILSDFGGPFGIRRLMIFVEVAEGTIRTRSALSSVMKDAEPEVDLFLRTCFCLSGCRSRKSEFAVFLADLLQLLLMSLLITFILAIVPECTI